MAAPIYTVEDIQSALQALLPRGRVWPRDPDTVQADFWKAVAGTYKRNSDAAAALLTDVFPGTTEFLLPEWEETLGLPDPCVVSAQTIAQRVAAVVAKLAHSGGQSIEYFVTLANILGYPDSTITQYAPFRAGRSHCGDRLGGEDWFFVWTFDSPDLPVTYFRAGASTAGDPLYSLGGPELRCAIQRFAPAHTNVLFSGFV